MKTRSYEEKAAYAIAVKICDTPEHYALVLYALKILLRPDEIMQAAGHVREILDSEPWDGSTLQEHLAAALLPFINPACARELDDFFVLCGSSWGIVRDTVAVYAGYSVEEAIRAEMRDADRLMKIGCKS